MLTNEEIRRQAELQRDYVVACRRTIHRFAEVSGTEFKTSAFIEGEIKKTGLPYEKAGDTGWIAILDTGKPGPRIALRADIDALPVPEEPNNLVGPRVVISDDPHTSHACGHDAHCAMLLGSMRALIANRDKLNGIIYFCFEEGEENGKGIPFMLNQLKEHGVDVVWGIHVYAGLSSGKICVSSGPRMAGAAGVNITVIGKGGHGSRPDMAANPVFCAAAILTNVATAWVNQISAGKTVTLGVTSIRGGETGNVIPDTASMIGSLRFFDDVEGKKAVNVFKSVAEHTAAMNNCHVEFGKDFQVLCAPVINDKYYSDIISAALPEVLPEGFQVSPCEPWYASEAFSRYREICPSVFAHLGINNPTYGSGAAHHNGFFDVDENVMPTGLIATMKFVDTVETDTQNTTKGGI